MQIPSMLGEVGTQAMPNTQTIIDLNEGDPLSHHANSSRHAERKARKNKCLWASTQMPVHLKAPTFPVGGPKGARSSVAQRQLLGETLSPYWGLPWTSRTWRTIVPIEMRSHAMTLRDRHGQAGAALPEK